MMNKGIVLGIFMGAGAALPGQADEVNNTNMPYRAYSETPEGERIEYEDGYQTLDDCKTAIIDFQRQVLAESEKYDEDHEGMGVFLHAANQIKCYAIGEPA